MRGSRANKFVAAAVVGVAAIAAVWLIGSKKSSSNTDASERTRVAANDGSPATSSAVSPRGRAHDFAAPGRVAGSGTFAAADMPKREIRKPIPAKFDSEQAERDWYQRSLTEARQLRDHLTTMHEHMRKANPPPASEVLARIGDEQADVDAWIRELEEKLASLQKADGSAAR